MFGKTLTSFGGKHAFYEFMNDGQLAVIHMNRTNARNALSIDMCRVMKECLQLASSPKSEIKAIVLTGNETSFSAGKDLKSSLGHSDVEAREYYETTLSTVRDFVSSPVPLISSIEKTCLGLGFELALATDIRVAGRSAKFSFPEINLSLFPGCDGAIMFPSLTGNVSLALDMVLTGRTLLAEEAKSFGIVARVVEDGRALEEAIQIGHSLCKKDRELLVAAKKVIRHNYFKEVTKEWQHVSEQERQKAGQSSAHLDALKQFMDRKK